MRYRADITAGSLELAESRVVANLLLRGPMSVAGKETVMAQNVLQTRNPATASARLRGLDGYACPAPHGGHAITSCRT